MNQNNNNYSIFLPPPNITGTLHMGHGFQHTIQDILIRYHKMQGCNTLWQIGTDHAGIATQIVVERNLETQNITKEDLGRDEFVERVWQWKEKSGNTILSQMQKLNLDCNWDRSRFTLDPELSKCVTQIFIDLYNEGSIYRDYRLVNWDTKRQTAVSDLEVRHIEEAGFLWHIRYNIKGSNEYLVVATSRPETLFGDVAIAINPLDTRFSHLIGKKAILPITNRLIPIIADDYVDINFGTGCLKVTPAHDFNDYTLGKKHNLTPINIFTLDGKLNDKTPTKYQGMSIINARKIVIDDLEQANLLIDKKPHKITIPKAERDDTILEPMLTHQWFLKMDKLAKRGLDLVNDENSNDPDKVTFYPNNWVNIYKQWLENIHDWCISRQLWWGHRIPAFYDNKGNHYIAHDINAAAKLSGVNVNELTQDNDVLDTWFSSALWCFATLLNDGGADKATNQADYNPQTKQYNNSEIEKYLPSNVLVTGFDIIFFWVARMIMLTDKFTGKLPFKHVYITGLIYDANGQKMSKSKGNIIDPIDLIEGISLEDLITKRTTGLMNPKMRDTITKQTTKDYPSGFASYGADALRFTFASLASNGKEIRFDMAKLESARMFCHKLENATKFIIMQITQGSHTKIPITNTQILDLFLKHDENYLAYSLNQLIINVDKYYKIYRFDLILHDIYQFFWYDFCSRYIELAKFNLSLTIGCLIVNDALGMYPKYSLYSKLENEQIYYYQQKKAPYRNNNDILLEFHDYITDSERLLFYEKLNNNNWRNISVIELTSFFKNLMIDVSQEQEISLKQQNIKTCLQNHLKKILQIIHPIMPDITTKLWHELVALDEQTVLSDNYPKLDLQKEYDETIEEYIKNYRNIIKWRDEFKNVFMSLRSIFKLAPSEQVKVIIEYDSKVINQDHLTFLTHYWHYFLVVCHFSGIFPHNVNLGSKLTNKFFKSLYGFNFTLDIDSDISITENIQKEKTKKLKEIEKLEKFFINVNYKTPQHLVANNQAKLDELKSQIIDIDKQLSTSTAQ